MLMSLKEDMLNIRVRKDKKPSIKRYSEKIRVQLRDMIDDLMEDASDNET